jgi:hypothetical protein
MYYTVFMEGFLLKRGAVGPTRQKFRRRWFCCDAEGNCVLYFVSERRPGPAFETEALGHVSLQEVLQVVVISGVMFEFDLICERRRWSFKAESYDSFLKWVDWFAARCNSQRPQLLPIEGFIKKRGTVNKAMKLRYFRQVGALVGQKPKRFSFWFFCCLIFQFKVYYFKQKQQAMNTNLAKGKIDLSKVMSVNGAAISLAEGSVTVACSSGRVYYLELPMTDFDRTRKKHKKESFAGF